MSENKKTKTLAIAVIAGVIIAAVIIGVVVSGKTSPAGGQKTLTVWLKEEVNETTNAKLKERVEAFGKENNINIEVELIPYEKMYPLWTSAIEAGTLPDVSYFQYQEAGQFYAQNLLLDVSDVLADIEAENGDIIDALVGPATYGGKVYAIPQKFYSVALHYRKDLLEAAGYKEPPKTWDEFREIAKAVTNVDQGIYGAGIGLGSTNSDAEWLNNCMLWAYGGSLEGEDSKTITANSQETVDALSYIASIYLEDGSTPPSAVNWDDAANNTAYLSGQAAMVFNAGTLLATIKKDDPELYEKTGIAPIPAGPDGSYVPSAGSYLGIFNTTKEPELAKELIKYLYDYDWYKGWMDIEMPSIVPVYEKAKEDAAWQEDNTKPFIDSMDNMCFIGYPGEYTPAAGEVFNLKLVNETLGNIVVNGMSPQQAADGLKTKIEEIFNK